MGYGAAGCDGLEALLKEGIEVCGVFCRTSDRQIQRGRPSVFTLAHRLGLHCFDEANPNDPSFVAKIRALAPDFIVSFQYDRILKSPLLEVPRIASVNLHYSPLPRLRGCFPTKWAIINDEPSGVTLHYINPGIDAGDIIDQTIVALSAQETDQSLYAKLESAAKTLFWKYVPALARRKLPPGTAQDEAHASYHPKKIPFDGIIDWSREAPFVERFIRAFTFPPHPAAKTWCQGVEIQLRAPVLADATHSTLAPGEFTMETPGQLRIGCGAGSIVVSRVLGEGQERSPVEFQKRFGDKGRFAQDGIRLDVKLNFEKA
jgi:methionyl-tRNA formyltransferase